MSNEMSGPDYAFERARLDKTIAYCRTIQAANTTSGTGTLFLRKRACRSDTNYAVFLRSINASGRTEKHVKKEELVRYSGLVELYCASKVLPKAEEALFTLMNEPLSYSIDDLQELYEILYRAFGALTPVPFQPNRLLIESWLSQPFPRNFRVDELTYRTARGEMVRSKLEVLIADALYYAGLPYLYELPLINERKKLNLLPDFTILDSQTGKIYYLEAFGMMDNAAYSAAALRKLRKYENAGFFPGENLITVFDGTAAPFDQTTFKKYLTRKFRL